MWAGSWAAPLPPPSGPAITGLGAAWGHRPRCQGRSPLPIQPGAHPGGCLCHLRSPCHRPRLPSGLPWGAPCWDPASVPASPPGLRRRGQSQGVCVPPPMACQEGLQPWHSPGTAAWRRRDRHRQRATPSPPAAPCEGQIMGSPPRSFPRSQIQPGAACQGWNLPPHSLPTPLCAPYQEPAPAPGGAQEGAAPFSHVDQAPLRDGAARLQHQLLGPEDPRLALPRDGEVRGRAATPGATPTPRAQPGTHPEVSTGLRRLRPRGVSIWRSRGGFGVTKHPGTTGTWCRWGWGCRDTPSSPGCAIRRMHPGRGIPKGAGAHPKHPKKSFTCCPGCVSRCLRVQTGTLLLLGDTGARHGGDSAPGGDGDSDATLTGSLQGGWARMGYTLWKQRQAEEQGGPGSGHPHGRVRCPCCPLR